jgi:hypothetical protein
MQKIYITESLIGFISTARVSNCRYNTAVEARNYGAFTHISLNHVEAFSEEKVALKSRLSGDNSALPLGVG